MSKFRIPIFVLVAIVLAAGVFGTTYVGLAGVDPSQPPSPVAEPKGHPKLESPLDRIAVSGVGTGPV